MIIAEALPRTRGLKFVRLQASKLHHRYCRGIAPNEGTEIHSAKSLKTELLIIAEALPRTRGLKFRYPGASKRVRHKIAEALPRTRGLKSGNQYILPSKSTNCRGIAPNEGTEIRATSTIYKILRGLQRHCPERGD